MTEVEVTDYETVEQTVTRYRCDHCDAIVEEPEISTVAYIDGTPKSTARVSDRSVETEHLCENCVGLREALRVRERKEYLRARWKGLSETGVKGLNLTVPLVAFVVGMATMLTTGVIETEEAVKPAYYIVEPILGGLVLIAALLCLGLVLGFVKFLTEEI